MEDNTEKREVNVANGLNVVDDVDVHTKPDAQSFIHLPNLQPVRAIFGFTSKINCLFAQVILNSRQDRRSQGPPLPPDVLARIQVVNGHPSKDLAVPVSQSVSSSPSTSPTSTTCHRCLTEQGRLDRDLRSIQALGGVQGEAPSNKL